MSETRTYQLLVFDWDGTLMDSQARIVACMQGAAKDVGARRLDDATVRSIIGLGLGEAVQALYPEVDKVFVEQFCEAYRQRFLFSETTPQVLFEGVGAMLAALERAGYLLAVATGKGRSGLNSVLQETQLTRCFHVTRCADESFSKPHPGMLEQIMEFTGVRPADTLMVGDTTFDLEMAFNAGVDAVGVSHGAHSVQSLLQWRPLTILERIETLPDWLHTQR